MGTKVKRLHRTVWGRFGVLRRRLDHEVASAHNNCLRAFYRRGTDGLVRFMLHDQAFKR